MKLSRLLRQFLAWMFSPTRCMFGNHEYVLSIDEKSMRLTMRCLHCLGQTPGWAAPKKAEKAEP